MGESTVEITAENFEKTLEGNGIVFLDFWASWCGPCRAFAPVYEKVAAKNSDIVFGKIDTEDQEELAAQFQIQAIPTLMIFREGIGVFSQAGALPEPVLEELVEKVRELDMEDVRRQLAEQQS